MQAPERVADTRFSHDRGFYDEPFEVLIESDTEGATIGWTLDGSDPRDSSTARSAPSPVRVRIDPSSREGRDLTPGVVLRAWASRDGLEPTDVDTQTYLFLDAVLRQPKEIGAGWRTYVYEGNGGPSEHDYEMDPAIVNDPAYAADLRAGLRSIPSMSLVMERESFWTMHDSADVEHPVSVEWIGARADGAGAGGMDLGGGGEQVDGAIEAHSHNRTKRSFRLVFRSETGGDWRTDMLARNPVSGGSAPDAVARVVLRAGNNRSWARSWNPDRTAYTVDEWYRTTQAAMSGYAAHGAFVHLYVNGIYWGLYNPVERPDRHWAARAFGGDDDDWAAASHGGWMAGDATRWEAMLKDVRGPLHDEAAFQRVSSRIDWAAFADYILLNCYIGIRDWPSNNWWALGSTTPPGPFRFAAWDGEWSFGNGFGSPKRPRVHPDLEAGDTVVGDKAPPIERLFNAAKVHPEFRILFADRVERAMGPGGALTDRAARARWAALNDRVRDPVVAESARWGDAIVGGPTRTRDEDWQHEVDFVDQYMVGAAEEMWGDLVRHNYVPSLDGERPFHAPRLERDGRRAEAWRVSAGADVPLRLVEDGDAGARILYTFGADPRRTGGGVADGLREAVNGVLEAPARTSVLRTRRLANGAEGVVWSPLREHLLVVPQDRTALRISEIHYHPAQDGATEFMELHNAGTRELDLGGLAFVEGVSYRFALGTRLAAGARLVLAADPDALEAVSRHRAFGAYRGRLDNGGEAIRLVDALGETVLELTYDDEAPWPVAPDGEGPSLVPIEPTGRAGSDPARWRASERSGGSPGLPDVATDVGRSYLPELLRPNS